MAADEQKTVTVTDLHGNEVEVPVGLDGENPVSPNNPPAKAVAEGDRDAAVARREAELKYAKELAEVSGAGENAAATNKEDNVPVTAGDADADADADETPAKSASKPEWVDYAVRKGADREEAEGKTVKQLQDEYGN